MLHDRGVNATQNIARVGIEKIKVEGRLPPYHYLEQFPPLAVLANQILIIDRQCAKMYNLDRLDIWRCIVTQNIWQLQDAKNRFSELVNKALDEGPQIVTRRGEEVVVVVSSKAYQKTIKSQTSLLEFFRQSPLLGVELDLERDPSFPRENQL